MIVGGQYGSEGKGAVTAYLAKDHDDLLAVRVAGPNAGHTVIGRCPPHCTQGMPVASITGGAAYTSDKKDKDFHPRNAHPWRLRQVPVAVVSNEKAILCIAPGSEIDPLVLTREVADLDMAGYRASSRLWLDYSATVIEEHHKQSDSPLIALVGSTGKGIGSARAERVMRKARLVQDIKDWPCQVADVAEHVRARLFHHGNVQIEGAQGYALGEHAGYYPYCTSSDCTAMDFLAMAGCPPWMVYRDEIEIWVVFRTYPIRVAGNSGPLQGETSWKSVGQPEELTTVTQKVRRVGAWDADLARAATTANGNMPGAKNPVRVALTMADYIVPELAGRRIVNDDITPEAHDLFDQLIARTTKDTNASVQLVGTSPNSFIDLRYAGRLINREAQAAK